MVTSMVSTRVSNRVSNRVRSVDVDPSTAPPPRPRRRVLFAVSVVGLVLAALAYTVPRSEAGGVPVASHHAAGSTAPRVLTAA